MVEMGCVEFVVGVQWCLLMLNFLGEDTWRSCFAYFLISRRTQFNDAVWSKHSWCGHENFKSKDWDCSFYGGIEEGLQPNMPKPQDFGFWMLVYIDSGILVYPWLVVWGLGSVFYSIKLLSIEWQRSRLVARVVSLVNSSKFIAMKHATEYASSLWYKLRMTVFPVKRLPLSMLMASLSLQIQALQSPCLKRSQTLLPIALCVKVALVMSGARHTLTLTIMTFQIC